MTPPMHNNMNQSVLDRLKAGNIYAHDPNKGQVSVVESIENEGASDALGAVRCETRSNVVECIDMVEARLGEH